MIESDKQLQITQEQINKFNAAIDKLKREKDVSTVLFKAELHALITKRDDLVKQINEYKKREED